MSVVEELGCFFDLNGFVKGILCFCSSPVELVMLF